MLEMSPAQCRAARALLDWSQSELAGAAKVGLSTVVDFERERRAVSDSATAAICSALEAAGVEFTNGGEPGVKLRAKIGEWIPPASSTVIAKGAEARGKGKTAVDEALADVPATDEEKAERRRRLTRIPKGLKPK
jgi:transcriptional regulator with XRE-family HTH domain